MRRSVRFAGRSRADASPEDWDFPLVVNNGAVILWPKAELYGWDRFPGDEKTHRLPDHSCKLLR